MRCSNSTVLRNIARRHLAFLDRYSTYEIRLFVKVTHPTTTNDISNSRSATPARRWLKLHQLLSYLFSILASSLPRYSSINCPLHFPRTLSFDTDAMPTRSITANRLIFSRSIFLEVFHETRRPSVQTSITAISLGNPWSLDKRSSHCSQSSKGL